MYVVVYKNNPRYKGTSAQVHFCCLKRVPPLKAAVRKLLPTCKKQPSLTTCLKQTLPQKDGRF